MNIPWHSIVRFGQQSMLEHDLFNVSWILGRFCNYNCSYCWPYAHTDRLDYQNLDVYKNAVFEIKKQATNHGFNKFHWSFSGGEPTAYKELLNLINYLETSEIYQSIHMTTNLSPSSKWWTAWLKTTNKFQRKSITASYHAEFAREQDFSDKILMLQSHGVFVTVNQVMVPNQFYELYERCQRFVNRGINVTLKPQSNSTANAVIDGYTDEMILLMQQGFPLKHSGEEIQQISLSDGTNTYYLDQAERFNSYGFNQFQGWSCNSGYQSIIIKGNEVKRGYSCSDMRLGTLSDGFRLFEQPQECVTPICVSSADSKIPKCK